MVIFVLGANLCRQLIFVRCSKLLFIGEQLVKHKCCFVETDSHRMRNLWPMLGGII